MKTMVIMLAAFVASIALGSAALAASVSISVGCTVPEIPGVNAPLKSDTSVRHDQLVKDSRSNDVIVRTYYAR
jgi:hypothetical protein